MHPAAGAGFNRSNACFGNVPSRRGRRAIPNEEALAKIQNCFECSPEEQNRAELRAVNLFPQARAAAVSRPFRGNKIMQTNGYSSRNRCSAWQTETDVARYGNNFRGENSPAMPGK